MRIPSGVTDQYIYFVAVDATDFTTRETGLSSFTVYRSRNGGAAAAMTTPTINETDSSNMPGVYELLLDEDMTIAAGNDSEEMVFHITHAGMAPVTRTIELYRPKITAGYTLGAGSDGDLLEVNTLTGHTAQTGDNYARIGAPAGASVSADIAALPTAAENRAEMDSNSTQLAAIVADTNELQGDWANGGRLDLLIDAIKAVTDNLNDPSVADILTTQMTESYAANGVAPTLAQALFAIHQKLMQGSYAGTTSTVYKLDNTTTAFTGTLDDGTNPTEDRRA